MKTLYSQDLTLAGRSLPSHILADHVGGDAGDRELGSFGVAGERHEQVLPGMGFPRMFPAGHGIPDSEKEAIFRKYHRAAAGQIPGSGIGLAFCRMACEALKGRIWVENTPQGGSRFVFELPSLRT